MFWNEEKVRANIQAARTEDLLDRITAYRLEMELHAIEMIEDELHARGVTPDQIADRGEEYERECLFEDGIAKMCSFCRKPAVAEGWYWHRLFRRLPLFPRWFRYCKEHAPVQPTSPAGRSPS
jgi:hypothetical protein